MFWPKVESTKKGTPKSERNRFSGIRVDNQSPQNYTPPNQNAVSQKLGDDVHKTGH